ncbi:MULTISPECIES: trimeric intracellular cation channel family protein [Aneurinibacillus]|uniref:Membrane protein n=1 Tax=Aneurinibacillus danicus TaxID=267746 RepID=A0A511V711_9BACL|nr:MULTISPECIES: trimeric intracellular cation channel family protein [Aneurinibacillus]GEN34724.1 membrane protein [Aneurinibacillus danicus]
MTWEILNIIGTMAFALSGAVVAMEEEYDIYGVFVLGMATAFGGGIVRNFLIGIPVPTLWEQGTLLWTALLTMLVFFFLPVKLIAYWRRSEVFFDAIGLAAFAVQGALYATQLDRPLSAIIVAAVMTGIGGGVIRDVLAGRRPMVLQEEIYAVWAIGAGLCIGTGIVDIGDSVQLYGLCVAIVVLRVLSVFYKWKLPRRSLHKAVQ